MARRTVILPATPLKELDTTGLRELDTTGLKELDTTGFQWAGAGRNLDDQATDDFDHIGGTRKFLRRSVRHTFETDGHAAAVCRDLARLPEPGEAYHLILDGRYPLWAFIPSILSLSGRTIAELQIATLGFSRDNIAQLCDLIDHGQIDGLGVSILASHYFAHSSTDIYDPAAAVIRERGGRLANCRTHCKIINARLSDGRTYTVESSANMRSCKNIEQATVATDRGLYDFHRGWILEMVEGGAHG